MALDEPLPMVPGALICGKCMQSQGSELNPDECGWWLCDGCNDYTGCYPNHRFREHLKNNNLPHMHGRYPEGEY